MEFVLSLLSVFLVVAAVAGVAASGKGRSGFGVAALVFCVPVFVMIVATVRSCGL
jgi:hypothetical protein